MTESGADPSSKNLDGFTPTTLASHNGNQELAEYLKSLSLVNGLDSPHPVGDRSFPHVGDELSSPEASVPNMSLRAPPAEDKGYEEGIFVHDLLLEIDDAQDKATRVGRPLGLLEALFEV